MQRLSRAESHMHHHYLQWGRPHLPDLSPLVFTAGVTHVLRQSIPSMTSCRCLVDPRCSTSWRLALQFMEHSIAPTVSAVMDGNVLGYPIAPTLSLTRTQQDLHINIAMSYHERKWFRSVVITEQGRGGDGGWEFQSDDETLEDTPLRRCTVNVWSDSMPMGPGIGEREVCIDCTYIQSGC